MQLPCRFPVKTFLYPRLCFMKFSLSMYRRAPCPMPSETSLACIAIESLPSFVYRLVTCPSPVLSDEYPLHCALFTSFLPPRSDVPCPDVRCISPQLALPRFLADLRECCVRVPSPRPAESDHRPRNFFTTSGLDVSSCQLAQHPVSYPSALQPACQRSQYRATASTFCYHADKRRTKAHA